MEPLISIIVPVYNVEPYLRKCVDSILNQTYRNLEVILVDDGSPDGCPAICDEYAAKDDRIKVIHKANGGLSDARNAGMAVARGEYLAFVDSDDMLPPDAMEILLNTAISEQADMVIGGYSRFEDIPAAPCDLKLSVKRWTPVETMADMFRNGCSSWARLYRRELHQSILFPVGEINEDEAIVLELLEKCNCIAVTNVVVYYYRFRPESITTASFNMKKMAWAKHCRDNLAFVREKYPELEADAAARYRGSVLWSLREICLLETGMDDAWKQLRRKLRQNFGIFRKGASLRDRVLMILLGYGPRKLLRSLFKKRSNV